MIMRMLTMRMIVVVLVGGNGSDMVYITQQTFLVGAFMKPVERIHFYS